jgi:hypothetical protein
VTDSFSFDAGVAAAAADPTAGGAVPVEKPPERQRYGALWPTPADQVSDHSAEGAPWLPTARGVPQDPPMGPLWHANHDDVQVPFSAQQGVDPVSGQWVNGPSVSEIHLDADGSPWNPGDWGRGGDTQPNAWALWNIGQPFTVNQGSRETRHLVTDQFDSTGKRINPPDAPSAPNEVYGSQHMTAPRLIPYEVAALFANEADSQQFSVNNG